MSSAAGSTDSPAALDIARSHALLLRIARGELDAGLRVYRPGATLAFGRLDARRPGFAEAVDAAAAHGFTPVLRLAGGHAAAYDDGSLVVERFLTSGSLHADLHARFAEMTTLMREALGGIAVEVGVGQLPGEYCPGQHSLHSRGEIKIAGVAQRVVRGAALVTAVIVIDHGARVRRVLGDVYAALELDWSPATAGALTEHHPGLTVERVGDAIAAADGAAERIVIDDVTEALAAELVDRHRVVPALRGGTQRHRTTVRTVASSAVSPEECSSCARPPST